MPSRSLANLDARASRRCDAPPQPERSKVKQEPTGTSIPNVNSGPHKTLLYSNPFGLRRHLCRLEALLILAPGLRDGAMHLLSPNGVK
jgi:hypothetical protein